MTGYREAKVTFGFVECPYFLKLFFKIFWCQKNHKDNGVVVTDTTDYYESLNKLFWDATKFKRLDANPTNTRLSALQSELRMLSNRNEISEEICLKSDQKT